MTSAERKLLLFLAENASAQLDPEGLAALGMAVHGPAATLKELIETVKAEARTNEPEMSA